MPYKEVDALLAGPIYRGVGAPPAQNLALDVALVQSLLNLAAKSKGAAKSMSPLPINGKCDRATIDRIKAFQMEFLSSKPNGRIEVNGKTWKKLVVVSNVRLNKSTKKSVIFGTAPVTFVRASVDRTRLRDMIKRHLLLNNKNEKLTDFLKLLFADTTLKNLRWMAYYLATVYHETMYTFNSIREVGKGSERQYGKKVVSVTDTHGYRGPKGKIYKNIYYGRGHVQLTHEEAYKYISDKIGLRKEELYIDPDKAQEFETSYKILTYWMQNDIPKVKGAGRKLQDHTDKGILDYKGARAIVNKGDLEERIANYARVFEILLVLSTRR